MKRRIIASTFAATTVVALTLSMAFFAGVASAHPSAPTMPTKIYRGTPRIHSNGTACSTNWSGYAVTGANGAYTVVSGSWVEPTATCTAGLPILPSGSASTATTPTASSSWEPTPTARAGHQPTTAGMRCTP